MTPYETKRGNIEPMINSLSVIKGTSNQSHVNLNWMSKLRHSDLSLSSKKSSSRKYNPPTVYYKQGPSRKDLMKYSYVGNFNDISHLGKQDRVHARAQPISSCTLKFASKLRNYRS